VKAKGFDVLREAGEARDLFNGGRMSNMLLSDSQRWELLANGPRRESPFNVPKYGLPPRSSLPVIEDVPVELPSPDSVWSIADFVVPQVGSCMY
jgi:alpha-amylase